MEVSLVLHERRYSYCTSWLVTYLYAKVLFLAPRYGLGLLVSWWIEIWFRGCWDATQAHCLPYLVKVFFLFSCQVCLLITTWLKYLKRARMCQLLLLEPFIISILSRLAGSYFLSAFVCGDAIIHKIFETNSRFHVK